MGLAELHLGVLQRKDFLRRFPSERSLLRGVSGIVLHAACAETPMLGGCGVDVLHAACELLLLAEAGSARCAWTELESHSSSELTRPPESAEGRGTQGTSGALTTFSSGMNEGW